MPRRWRAALLALAAVAACLPFTPATALTATTNFWVHCLPTGQVATIDPIVDPGSTTTSHYHVFFGNTALDQNSTPASLQAAGAGATSCTTATDTAGYWAPELELAPGTVQNFSPPGLPCQPLPNGSEACAYTNIRVYYGTGGTARSALTGVPAAAEMIGGDHAATGPQPLSHVSFACGGSSPAEQYPYDCAGYVNTTGNADQDGVVIDVKLPRCWDGLGTAITDFSYPPCAAGTKILPLISERFHTGIVDPCPGQSCPAGSKVTPGFGFRMADDSLMPWYDAHADFMDGWQAGDGGLTDLVGDCLISALPCPVNPHTSPTSNMPT